MIINIRTKTRKYIVQVLYTWELSKNNMLNIQEQYFKIINVKKIDIQYFNTILTGINKNYKKIDKIIYLNLNRKSQEISQIEKAILRLSLYELYERPDIPYKVSINEGIELAKIFGSHNSYKFINGILDQAWNNIKKKKST